MSALENRYRAALRWYPRLWRERNQEAVVGTLLDVAESDGRSRPRLTELVNLMAHGVAARVRTLPSVVPSSVRDRTSTAALAVGAAIALASIMQLESGSARAVGWFGREYATFGPFASPMIVVYAAWMGAFFAAISGAHRLARWIAVATIPLIVAGRVLADATDMLLRPTWTLLGILILLAALVAAGVPAPRRAGVKWLLAWFLPAIAVFTLPQTMIDPGGSAFQVPLWLDPPTILAWSPAIATVGAVGARIIRQGSWSLPVLTLGIPFSAAAINARGVSGEVATSLALAALALGVALVITGILGFRLRVERVRPSASQGWSETAPPARTARPR